MKTSIQGRPAVFLDRDGTLIREAYYLSDPDGIELVDGAVRALEELRAAGFLLVVVTNQSGIARGLYSLDDYHGVAAELDRRLTQAGVPLDATYYCPHHPDHGPPCTCRKPNSGMYRRAEEELGVELSASWFVGDKTSDVVPAAELGGRAVLVRTGFGREHEDHVGRDVAVVDDLPAAARLILEHST